VTGRYDEVFDRFVIQLCADANSRTRYGIVRAISACTTFKHLLQVSEQNRIHTDKLPLVQDMSSALDLHSLLLGNPLDSLNNQAALALLLAANSQGSAAARSAGTPTWHINVPTDFSAIAPAHLRAHILATSGSDTSGPPYLHNEEAVLAQHHWTGWNSRRMGPSLNVGQLSVPDAATLPAALPGWPGAADSMYQPAVPSMLFRNNINTLVPDVPDVQMAGAQPEPCEMSFGHGPRRHSNIRDVQYVRHSPY